MKKKFSSYGIKGMALLLGIILLLSTGSGLTAAWLSADADPLLNLFAKSNAPPEVVEEFDGETKENVRIKNTGNIDAFIRVILTAVWLDDQGNISAEPVPALSFTSHSNWFEKDGVYYHKERVAPGALTTNLIDTFVMPVKEGLRFELQVITSAIQADPDEAVEHAWPVTVDGSGRLQDPAVTP